MERCCETLSVKLIYAMYLYEMECINIIYLQIDVTQQASIKLDYNLLAELRIHSVRFMDRRIPYGLIVKTYRFYKIIRKCTYLYFIIICTLNV